MAIAEGQSCQKLPFEKIVAMDLNLKDWPKSDMQAIKAPTLVISGDADIIKPEHSIEIYRTQRGGPSPDFMTAPAAELAILPGTSHLGVMEKADIVTRFVTAFFDKPIK